MRIARLDGGALARRERRHRRCAARPRRSGCRGRRASARRGRPGRSTASEPAFVTSTRARAWSCPPAAPPAAARPSGRREVPSTRLASLTAVEPLLVRAARLEPVERTPVWFMRQAGPLAARVPRDSRAALLLGGRAHARALRRGDAAAGAPPRRRRGRDVRRHHDPGARHGARRRPRRGRRPGDRGAGADACRRRAAARARSRRGVRAAARGDPDRARRARAGAGGRRLLRRAVHGRRLPRRRQAVARVRDGEDDDVLRARRSGAR